MKKSILPTLLLAMLFALPSVLFSQAKMKITGTISDSSKSLSYVTVRLLKKDNPAVLQTIISKEDGSFQLNKPPAGDYVLSFTHTGFAEKRLPVSVTAEAGDM